MSHLPWALKTLQKRSEDSSAPDELRFNSAIALMNTAKAYNQVEYQTIAEDLLKDLAETTGDGEVFLSCVSALLEQEEQPRFDEIPDSPFDDLDF